jgi:hypothetical protein
VQRYQAQMRTQRSVAVQQKRLIFNIMRSMDHTLIPDIYLPQSGLFLGEFSLWHILADSPLALTEKAGKAPAENCRQQEKAK